MSVGQAMRSPQFIILLLTNFFCCATHSGPIFHTVSYAVSCGIPMIAAVSIYSVEGLAGMGGRVAFGILGDRFGAKRVLVAGLLLQAFGALAYVFVRELGAFYAVAALFGFIYAGVMPLYAVLARENFPLRMMGTVIGGTAMAGSLGHGHWPVGRRPDLRHLRQLQLALCRLLGHRHRRLPDRADLQALPSIPDRASAGLMSSNNSQLRYSVPWMTNVSRPALATALSRQVMMILLPMIASCRSPPPSWK